MDSNYVINITDNLDDLNRDMLDWSMLPLDFKMTGNDNCVAKYGCTVTDLYNKLKNTILNHKERIEDNSIHNLVFESAFIDDPNYEELIKKSNDLQKSPYIVIINPDDSKEELFVKYNTFFSLDATHRRLSDYYSWLIWGYNVYNMFDIVSSMLDNEKEDEPNLVFGESVNLDSCLDGSYDFLNKAIIEGDILTVEKFKQNLKCRKISKPVLEAACNDKIDFLYNHKVSATIFPKVVPWFTEQERMNYLKEYNNDIIKYSDKYYKNLKLAEANKDTTMLINLGWNPTVPVNEETINVALSRQLNEANNTNIYDITKLSNYDNCNDIKIRDISIKPIYFVFWEDNVAIAFSDQFKLSSSLRTMYKFENINNSFSGFKKISATDIIPNIEIKLICVFVDKNAYNILYNNITANPNLDNIGSQYFNSIYNILLKSRNMNDPDRMKIVYSYYIDMLLKLICFDSESNEITDPHYIDSRMKTIFLLYKGKYEDYESSYIDNIMRIICNDTNLEKYLKDNEFELDRELISKLKATPCIYIDQN